MAARGAPKTDLPCPVGSGERALDRLIGHQLILPGYETLPSYSAPGGTNTEPVATRAAMAAGGLALTMALQSALAVAAAPHSTPAQSSTPKATAMQGQPAVSQGRLFGKFVSTTARIFPAGPQHGKVISAFATSANPGHTRHANRPDHSVKAKQ